MRHFPLDILLFNLGLLITLIHSQATSPDLPSSTASVASSTPTLSDVDRNKYFHESSGLDADHFDARYFHGGLAVEERKNSLRHMITAYLLAFQELGLETWIAHGTLLGWWWNGKILPWDNDVDTQVSEPTLKYLAEHHNQTTHKYSSADGSFRRTYLLDVNPWSTQRDHGDGANVIDARWIDMTSGLYIDITGLAEANPVDKPAIWSCKNSHDYRVRDLYPMRHSIFEGVPARIPYAYDQILMEEYGPQALTTINLTTINHQEYRWHEDMREWIPAPNMTGDGAQ